MSTKTIYLNLFLTFLLFYSCQSDTVFTHLFGYSLSADVLSTYSTFNATDCMEECVETTGCVGAQMLWGTGNCNLLTMIRAATTENADCTYYIENFPEVEVTGRSLDTLNQLVQNAVYASQNECPDGWTTGSTTCTLAVTQTVCNEYASFLETSWDGTECVIPLMNVTYVCPNSSFTLGSFTDGHYCYIVINKWTSNPDNLSWYGRCDQYCTEVTGGYLASIHSEEENALINELQLASNVSLKGLIIGLVSLSGEITSINDVSWLDGTALTYRNFYPVTDTPKNNTAFQLTIMTASGEWNTAPASATSVLRIIPCKQNAITVLTPLN